MRTTTLIAALTVALLATDALVAQRGGGRGGRSNRWRRPEGINNRVAAYFTKTPGPATQGDKVADLKTIDLVRAASAAGQVTLLYLHDGQAQKNVVRRFESALFRGDSSGDELGIKLRMFHCAQIDVSATPALKARFGDDTPMFIAFDKTGRELKAVSMTGYKAKASALEALIDKAGKGAFKPNLTTFAKKYGDFVDDLEKVLRAKVLAEQDQAKAGKDKAKRKKAEKELAVAQKAEQKLLAKERKMLAGMRLPARGEKKIGGRRTRGQNGNTSRGNTGKGNTGRGNPGKGNTGRGNTGRGKTGG